MMRRGGEIIAEGKVEEGRMGNWRDRVQGRLDDGDDDERVASRKWKGGKTRRGQSPRLFDI